MTRCIFVYSLIYCFWHCEIIYISIHKHFLTSILVTYIFLSQSMDFCLLNVDYCSFIFMYFASMHHSGLPLGEGDHLSDWAQDLFVTNGGLCLLILTCSWML